MTTTSAAAQLSTATALELSAQASLSDFERKALAFQFAALAAAKTA